MDAHGQRSGKGARRSSTCFTPRLSCNCGNAFLTVAEFAKGELMKRLRPSTIATTRDADVHPSPLSGFCVRRFAGGPGQQLLRRQIGPRRLVREVLNVPFALSLSSLELVKTGWNVLVQTYTFYLAYIPNDFDTIWLTNLNLCYLQNVAGDC